MTVKQKQKYRSSHHKSRKKNRSSKERYFGLANKLIAVLIIASSVYYIISINDISIKGFVLEDLKHQASELAGINEEAELRAMALQSYEAIDLRAEELKMVKVDRIDYITVSEEAMALK